MADVRRIPDEQGPGSVPVEVVIGPVVTEDDPAAVLQAGSREITAGDRGGQRVDFDSNEFGALKAPARSEEKAAGAGTRIDDPRRRLLLDGPRQHGIDDAQWRIGRAELSARFRAPEAGEHLAQRVVAGTDLVSQLVEKIRGNNLCVASELLFGGGPAGHVACAKTKSCVQKTRLSPLDAHQKGYGPWQSSKHRPQRKTIDQQASDRFPAAMSIAYDG